MRHKHLQTKNHKKIHSDLTRVKKITEQQLARDIARDIDSAPLLKNWPADAQVFIPQNKIPISLRIDADVLAFFKKQGKGHLTYINYVLRSYMKAIKSKLRTRTA